MSFFLSHTVEYLQVGFLKRDVDPIGHFFRLLPYLHTNHDGKDVYFL
jgi:hypothetical protein